MLVLFVKQLNVLICRNVCYSKNSIDRKIILGVVKYKYLINYIDIITLNSDRHIYRTDISFQLGPMDLPQWHCKNEPLCRMASFQVEAQRITIHILQRSCIIM